jgi:pantoate--beta-alanine ligase
MGFFHEGHLTLMREGRKYGDCLVVSIFVNPTQFGPSEDLQAYPRDLDRDIRMADAVGVDVVFAPDSNDMYVKDHQTYVDLDILPKTLCGLSRPGHFRGVATVVTKLFNIVKPQVALAIIRRMAQDLSVDINIVGVPTVREIDGLAMSSRNTYLSAEERQSALSLFQSLQRAQNRVAEGVKDARTIVEEVSAFKKDYVVLCDPETLADVQRIDNPSLLALAIMVGKTRLIDNAILTP